MDLYAKAATTIIILTMERNRTPERKVTTTAKRVIPITKERKAVLITITEKVMTPQEEWKPLPHTNPSVILKLFLNGCNKPVIVAVSVVQAI